MRCARGADITFLYNFFHNTVFPIKSARLPHDFENDIYDYSSHFQYAQERKKRKKETYNIIINKG